MSKICLSLIAILLIACGEKNKSSSQRDEGVPVITTSPVLALASDFGEVALLKDNYRLFRIELTRDFNFVLLQKRGRRLEQVLNSRWSANGATVNLEQLGQGQYTEIDFQGQRYACLFIRPETLSSAVKSLMAEARIIDNNPQLKFCRLLRSSTL